MIDEIAQPGIPREVVQRRLAQAGLGVLKALRGGTMTIKHAEDDLFNVDTYRAARRRRFDPSLVTFLEWGMELGDVADLAPDGIEESYGNMEQLLLRVISASLGNRRRPTKRSDG
jgi:hypothetical protein